MRKIFVPMVASLAIIAGLPGIAYAKSGVNISPPRSRGKHCFK